MTGIRQRIKDIQLSIREISRKAQEQEDVIRFDIGQPDFDTPDHVKEYAREMIDVKQDYTATEGIQEVRETIAEEENSKPGIDGVTAENVVATCGGTQALQSTYAAHLEKGDQVALNNPTWGPYKLIADVHGVEYESVRFFDENGLRDRAKKVIEESEMVITNTPNNPTGHVYSEGEAREIAEVAENAQTLLVSDEVYWQLTYGEKHVSPASFTDHSVIIGSVSKNHAMTGWRLGWAVTDEARASCLAKTSRGVIGHPTKISQLAAIEAIRNPVHVEKMRKSYSTRRDLVEKRLEELDWSFTDPAGSLYVFPEIGHDTWDFCLEMIEEGVAMVPGHSFGSPEHVRICFGTTSSEEIEKAFDRLENSELI